MSLGQIKNVCYQNEITQPLVYNKKVEIKLSYRIYWQLSSREKAQHILETNDGEWNVRFNAISKGAPIRNKHITYAQFRIKTARNICHLT